MRISINSTFSYIKFNLNYGSALQCYALQQYLKDRGHEPEHLRDYRANPILIIKRLKNIKYFDLFCKKTKAMFEMQRFIRKNLELSDRGFFSDRGLREHCPDVECHIVGSDQIWHNTNSFRYLTYAPDDKLKLSYAASFGRANISESMKNTIGPWLNRFDGISVREKSAVRIVDSITNVGAVHVLDPTLLLDWERYPYKSTTLIDPGAHYCYCYFLNLKNTDSVAYDNIKSLVSEKNSSLYLTAPLNYPLFLGENLIFPSVEEWLGLYKNADCIFTNTYHGLLFCIIFKKRFVFFIQNSDQASENERFYSLLEMLDLKSRVATERTLEEIRSIVDSPIDYDRVYGIIKEKRAETDAFFERFGI